MNFESKSPIYLQLLDDIRCEIISGDLKPGEKLSSVGELAIKFKVNPNTVQRTMEKLELDKVVYTENTNYRFVTKDEAVIENMRKEYLNYKVSEFVKLIYKMGYDEDDVLKTIHNFDSIRRLNNGK